MSTQRRITGQRIRAGSCQRTVGIMTQHCKAGQHATCYHTYRERHNVIVCMCSCHGTQLKLNLEAA